MDKILVIGSYNVGLTVFGPTIPKSGQTVMGNHFDVGPGGKGSNQAVGIGRLGGDVTFLAKVGGDTFGRDAMDLFRREGINTDYIRTDEASHTGAGIIFVDAEGHNAIGVAPGANLNLTPDELDSNDELFAQSACVLMQLEIAMPTVYHAIEKAKKHGCTVVVNPAPAQKLDPRYISMIDILTPNESEAEVLTGIAVTDRESAAAAARALRAQGVATVIVTMGGQGSLLVSEGVEEQFPAYQVEAVDTTGAGDAYNAGLVYAMAAGRDIGQAIDFGSKVAAILVTNIGCVPGLPTLAEVEGFSGNAAHG